MDSRGSDLKEFFRHESSSSPPALSSCGTLHACTKSDLLKCLMDSTTSTVDDKPVSPRFYDFIVFDGGYLIHALPAKQTKGETFYKYFEKVFLPRILHELGFAPRVDVVLDRYIPMSIKESTKEKRGHSSRQRVTGLAKVPGDWQQFMMNTDNKRELFTYLSSMLAIEKIQEGKELYITEDDNVRHVGDGTPMGKCNHEEADTRILVHLLHALQAKSLGLIHTGDTDVVVILLANYHHIIAANSAADIWIYFHAGKSKKIIHLNSIAANLGPETCKSLALFHAFTGSDSTSAFKFKGKRSCWNILTKAPMSHVIHEFSNIVDATFQISPSLREASANFVCQLYNGGANEQNVDILRMDIFSHKTRDVDRIPPTSNALHQHLKGSVFQASIWATAKKPLTFHPNPFDYGWKEDNGRLIPVWTTLPEAKDVFYMDIKCSCKQSCSFQKCKCTKANLDCSLLCKCHCIK